MVQRVSVSFSSSRPESGHHHLVLFSDTSCPNIFRHLTAARVAVCGPTGGAQSWQSRPGPSTPSSKMQHSLILTTLLGQHDTWPSRANERAAPAHLKRSLCSAALHPTGPLAYPCPATPSPPPPQPRSEFLQVSSPPPASSVARLLLFRRTAFLHHSSGLRFGNLESSVHLLH